MWSADEQDKKNHTPTNLTLPTHVPGLKGSSAFIATYLNVLLPGVWVFASENPALDILCAGGDQQQESKHTQVYNAPKRYVIATTTLLCLIRR